MWRLIALVGNTLTQDSLEWSGTTHHFKGPAATCAAGWNRIKLCSSHDWSLLGKKASLGSSYFVLCVLALQLRNTNDVGDYWETGCVLGRTGGSICVMMCDQDRFGTNPVVSGILTSGALILDKVSSSSVDVITWYPHHTWFCLIPLSFALACLSLYSSSRFPSSQGEIYLQKRSVFTLGLCFSAWVHECPMCMIVSLSGSLNGFCETCVAAHRIWLLPCKSSPILPCFF